MIRLYYFHHEISRVLVPKNSHYELFENGKNCLFPTQKSGRYRSSRCQMFFKIGVPKNFVTFTGKHLCWSLFLIKLQAFRLIPIRVFSCEYCEIFKNTYFEEYLPTAASVDRLRKMVFGLVFLTISLHNMAA